VPLAAGRTSDPTLYAIQSVSAAGDQRKQIVEAGAFQTDYFTIV
jgi:hypothetical protein